MSILTLEERQRRWQKVRQAMNKRGIDCLIVWGSFGGFRNLTANLIYLSNVTTEGYLVFPAQDEPTLFTFLKGSDPEPWVTDWRCGHPTYSKAISDRLRELHLESGNLGIVGLSGYYGEMGFPHSTYMSIANSLPKAEFEDATDIVEDARLIKSDAEIKCFEIGCEIADKTIQAIMETAKAGVKDYEIVATIMDTLYRNGSEPGSMLLYISGKEATHAGHGGFFKAPSQRTLGLSDVLLVEFDAKYLGYEVQYNQPFAIGKPNKEWQDVFDVALRSFNNGLKTLKPGITVGELDEAFISPIKEAGFTYTHPAFHGLSLGLEMPMGSFPIQPLHKPNVSLRIEAGMVFEFEPQAVSPDGKRGVHIGIPVLVTENGCRLLSKIWKPEFKVV